MVNSLETFDLLPTSEIMFPCQVGNIFTSYHHRFEYVLGLKAYKDSTINPQRTVDKHLGQNNLITSASSAVKMVGYKLGVLQKICSGIYILKLVELSIYKCTKSAGVSPLK